MRRRARAAVGTEGNGKDKVATGWVEGEAIADAKGEATSEAVGHADATESGAAAAEAASDSAVEGESSAAGAEAAADSAAEGELSAAAAEAAPDSAAEAEQCFQISSTKKRGRVAVATRAIKCGERVLSEAPLLFYEGPPASGWAKTVQKQVAALSQEHIAEIMSLSDAFAKEGVKTVEGILRTNGLSRGAPNDGVLCLKMSRFNHSCVPNCDWSWDQATQRVDVYANTDIASGEELCIYYVEIRATRKQRAAELMEKYRFSCNCPACAAADPKSDERRTKMSKLNKNIENMGIDDPKAGLTAVNELMALYIEERIHLKSFRKRAAFYAFQFSHILGDCEGAIWWVERALEYSVICHGPDHQQSRKLQGYVKDPHSHPASGKKRFRSICFSLGVQLLGLGVVMVSLYRAFVLPNGGGNTGHELEDAAHVDAGPPL